MEQVALETSDLLTVAGASAAAYIVTQFAKMLLTLSTAVVRSVSLVTGLVVVVGATILTGNSGPVEVGLSVIVGMQAGMATWAMFDAATSGLTYRTEKVEG